MNIAGFEIADCQLISGEGAGQLAIGN
jgi:hypothetical protein